MNKINKPKSLFAISLVFVLAGLLVFGYGKDAYSQAGSGIAFSHVRYELEGNPGERLENFARFTNTSEERTLQIVMETESIFPEGEEGHVVPGEDDETFSLSQWIRTNPREFTLEPGEERVVRFIIDIPENAEPGGHYAAVFAHAVGAEGPDGIGVDVSHRGGPLVLLTVPGEMVYELNTLGLEAPNYSEYGPIPFEARLENTGTVHTRPEAQIEITNIFGDTVAVLELEEKNIIPDAVRRLDAVWEEEYLWWGRYTATLTGTYAGGEEELEEVSITFWAFPWKYGLAGFVVLVFLFLTRKRWAKVFRILIKGE